MKAAAEYQTDGSYGMVMFSFILLLLEEPTCMQNPLTVNTKYSACSQANCFLNNKVLEDQDSEVSCLELFHGIFQIPTLTLGSPDQSSPIRLPETHGVILQGFTQEAAMHLPQLCMDGF